MKIRFLSPFWTVIAPLMLASVTHAVELACEERGGCPPGVALIQVISTEHEEVKSQCSGFAIQPSLVLSAGHCFSPHLNEIEAGAALIRLSIWTGRSTVARTSRRTIAQVSPLLDSGSLSFSREDNHADYGAVFLDDPIETTRALFESHSLQWLPRLNRRARRVAMGADRSLFHASAWVVRPTERAYRNSTLRRRAYPIHRISLESASASRRTSDAEVSAMNQGNSLEFYTDSGIIRGDSGGAVFHRTRGFVGMVRGFPADAAIRLHRLSRLNTPEWVRGNQTLLVAPLQVLDFEHFLERALSVADPKESQELLTDSAAAGPPR